MLTFLYLIDGGFQSAVGSLGEGTLMQGTMKYVTADSCASYYSEYDITFDSSMACAYNKGKTTMCSVSSVRSCNMTNCYAKLPRTVRIRKPKISKLREK